MRNVQVSRPAQAATAGRGSSVLSIEGLTKTYGEVLALDEASFSVAPARIVGFLGPNGAGKTTTMRCIFGLANPDAGSITWDGQPIDDTLRLSFGYMPEERGLYPRMRIGDQLAYLGRLSGMAAADARQATGTWLERLGLSDRMDSRLEQLSHGNQQRVQLAAALIHRPVLAVLDEPFAGLDPIGVETMSEILRSLAAGGTSVLFSSHQLDLVEDVCQDVVIIEAGRVVMAGNVEELRRSSPIRIVEVMVDERPWTSPLFEVEDDTNGRIRHRVKTGVDLREVVEAAGADGTITRLVFEPPSLSDLFRQAVGR
jgi:ABC-2 type transport system ATP-binding protein